MTPPSRWSNPFATCWTRSDVLLRHDRAGQGAHDLLVQLKKAAWRGQVVGPHGAGKTSLLMEIARRLPEQGRTPLWVSVDSSNLREALQLVRQSADSRAVVLLEGFERVGRWHQHRLLAACAGRGSGWLLTTHEKIWCKRTPIVAQVQPTLETTLQLYEHLTEQRSSLVTRNDVTRSFRDQGGNLREVWFDLYERHERLTRQRTTAVAATYG